MVNHLDVERLINGEIVGELFETTRQGMVHNDKTSPGGPSIGDSRSLGPNTIVRVVSVTKSHSEFPKHGYGPGLGVTPAIKNHKHSNKLFYVPWSDITSGFLRR